VLGRLSADSLRERGFLEVLREIFSHHFTAICAPAKVIFPTPKQGLAIAGQAAKVERPRRWRKTAELAKSGPQCFNRNY